MRFAIFCGSLEPGRDGVGDYTRRLGCECIRSGHEVVAIALNDQYVDRSLVGIQSMENISMSCLRLPATSTWASRIVETRKWLEPFGPEWASLQFVPFGYQSKGLCFGLGKKIRAICPGARWQIMFHELWLGLGRGSSLKHRLWGTLQKSIILDLVDRLNGPVIFTQADPYRQALQRENINATLLPLFSNITYTAGDAWDELLAPAMKNATGTAADRQGLYLAGIFGAVHPEWSAQKTANALFPLAQRFGRRLVLVFFGKSHLSPQQLTGLKNALQDQAVVLTLGERTPAEISWILQTLDLGLATTPLQVIQKSGTAAAMWAHGLPLLVTRDDWHLAGPDSRPLAPLPQLFFPEQLVLLNALPVRDARLAATNDTATVAQKMIQIMNAAPPPGTTASA